MVSSLQHYNKFHKKSISLQCISHPSTLRIEQELLKIKATSSTKPCPNNGNFWMAELYKWVDDLLNSWATKKLISSHRNEKCVEEVMEISMKFLDICSILRDVVMKMGDHVRGLQCAIRRRKGHSSGIKLTTKEYNCFMKRRMKDAKELIMSLKQSQKEMGLVADHGNHHLIAVIRVFVEVTKITIVIFDSLVTFLVSPVSKPNGWSLVLSKLIHKPTLAYLVDGAQDGTTEEPETINATLCNILYNFKEESIERRRIGEFKLEGLHAKMVTMESDLECMFRRFVKTRATLLNIISL